MSSPDPSPEPPRPEAPKWIPLLGIFGAILGVVLIFTPTRVQNAALALFGVIGSGAGGLALLGNAYLISLQRRPVFAAMFVLLGFILLGLAYQSGVRFTRLVRVE